LLDLLKERSINVALTSFNREQIIKMTNFSLTDAMNPTEALLDPVGVPRQIVVHHQVSTLKIDALARSIGRKEDQRRWIM
jgi:hypothetical protein